MNSLYTVLFYVSLPLICLRLWWRGRKLPAYRQRIGERMARYTSPALKECLWLHAVSYGETVAANDLIEQLLEHYPNTPILITNMTTTGSERVRHQFADRVHNVYLPYDLPSLVKRFLAHFRPKLGIIMETELWPNLLQQCHNQGIPILLANARLSEKSTRGYAKISPMTRRMLSHIHTIAAQTRTDARRFQLLGASKQQTVVFGNLKYDLQPNDQQIAQGLNAKALWQANNRPVWIAASTHEGEEEIVLTAHTQLKKQHPDLLLILVPRHPDRFQDVAELCQRQGYRLLRHSEQVSPNRNTDILLGDTMGEMFYFYAQSDVVFLGGSIMPIGGHNIIEPISVGLPVLTGPHLHHIAEMQNLFPKDQCRLEVNDATELASAVDTLLTHPEQASRLVHAAQTAHTANQGALKKHLQRIHSLLSH